jgi:hypothetical protein
MTVTLRQESAAGATTKGSALTFQELDNNFVHLLRQGTVEVKADSGSSLTLGEADKDSILQFAGAGNVATTISSDSAGETVITFTGTPTDTQIVGGSGIAVTQPDSAGAFTIAVDDISADTSPQLGGNLDVNCTSIVSVSNGNIAITPNGTGQVQTTNLRYDEDIHDLGTTGGTITPDVANGNVQTITLNNNLTFSAFSNPIAGQSLTLIIDTNGTNRTLTSTMKFAGGSKTMSTTDTFDIMTVFYDGTRYYASYSTNFS